MMRHLQRIGGGGAASCQVLAAGCFTAASRTLAQFLLYTQEAPTTRIRSSRLGRNADLLTKVTDQNAILVRHQLFDHRPGTATTATRPRRRTLAPAHRRGVAPRLRIGLLVLALATWLAVAAAHAQTGSEVTVPGQVGAGKLGNDGNAPGEHRAGYKWVFSHSGALEITWRPPANDGGAAVTTYRVYWYQTSDHAGTVQSRDVTPSGAGLQVYYVTGLTNGVEYGVGVTAVNSAGEGPFRSGTGAALASLPYSSPRDDMYINVPNSPHDMEVRDLAATRSGANALRVTWRAPSGTGAIEFYVLSWAPGSGAAVHNLAINRTTTSYGITGLDGGKQYQIRVHTAYRVDGGDEGILTVTAVTFATRTADRGCRATCRCWATTARWR